MNTLETPINMEELGVVVKQSKVGKSPRPDRFSLRYYKSFLPTLAPNFLKAINSITSMESIPKQALMANIYLIHKERKDSTMSSNYCLIF